MKESNVVMFPSNRNSPDYTGNHKHSQELVNRLMEYYHSRGYKWFKAWLEPETFASGRKFWCVRSNAMFRVPQL